MDCKVHRLVADVALFAEGRVLLVKYRDTSRYDRQAGWFLPDDYLEHEEHPEDAARRIVAEQAGLAIPKVRLDAVESFGNGFWHLVFHYRAQLDKAEPISLTGNVAEAEWFALDSLPEASEVAHEGWALDVLSKMTAG
jgi:ADP-ribose pyrophosphatase YjhB (NUDIX family)